MSEFVTFLGFLTASIVFSVIVKKIHECTRKEQALFLLEVWANNGETKQDGTEFDYFETPFEGENNG